MRLDQKVALITGGGSGIGRSSAILFASEGAKVVVCDVDDSLAQQAVEKIKMTGGTASCVQGDVTSSNDAENMVREAVDTYGKLDVLVNSAGISALSNDFVPNASSEQIWDRVIEVNLKGTYLVSYYAVPEMVRLGGGSVINLASIVGLVGYPADIPGLGGGFNPYAASKGGVVQFTRNLAVAYAKDNVRVNCICPGYTWTNLTNPLTSNPDILKSLEDKHPMGRLGQPEEIAYAALYLASDESLYVTGAPLVVDGGYTAQ